jgi:hypothetical protein
MSIDPKKLAAQRWKAERPKDTLCDCGTRTRDASGKCRACRIDLPKVKTMSTENLIRMATIVGQEIKERQAAMAKAINALRVEAK